MPSLDEVRSIGILLFSGFSLSETAIILEIFQSANELTQSKTLARARIRYDVTLLSVAGGSVDSSSSVFVWTERVENHRIVGGFHTLFVAGGAGAPQALRDERLIRWLQREVSLCNVVVPIGNGRLLLDAAGVKRSMSGWDAVCSEAMKPHRRGKGDFGLMATAPVRKAIALIEQDLGGEFALEAVGRVLAENPPASLTATIHETGAGVVSERIHASARWMEENCARALTIEEIAKFSSMSGRNFLRRFRAEMGVTPSDYLLRIRINTSCRLLIETDLSVDEVARHCGLGSGGWLSKLFRRHLSTTPGEYRARMRHAGA
ncbi:GlxA family transcriptional regulator [Paraburkholderia sp. J94]|uniref:GlxA family transcriptional regulator n=1 Tax=Paraburkholderia sp. J94 TaxID=2805441 RepID=UPI002AB273E7|nr:helix-turn-helix domain-containing protein [Paraburkholderia sp. J94]